jgi:hypothetical protein
MSCRFAASNNLSILLERVRFQASSLQVLAWFHPGNALHALQVLPNLACVFTTDLLLQEPIILRRVPPLPRLVSHALQAITAIQEAAVQHNVHLAPTPIPPEALRHLLVLLARQVTIVQQAVLILHPVWQVFLSN